MRTLRILFTVVAAVAVGLMAFGGVASGGQNQPLTVTATKVVTGGTQPAGATYTVLVTCSPTNPGVITAQGNANFNGPGGPTTMISASLLVGNHPFCTVVESPNGGAASTTITCVPSSGALAGTNICNATGNFDILNVAPQTITVTVTNTFAADPVVVTPRFTG